MRRNENKKKSVKKTLCAFTLCGLMAVTPPFALSGCSESKEAGTTWYSGTANIDTVTQGKTGDFYWDTDDYKVYEKGEDGAWTVVVDEFGLVGETGAQGPAGSNGQNGTNGTNGKDGATWLSGITNPVNTLGENGDYYLNSVSFDVYKKADGVWAVVCNIKGEDGDVPTIGSNGNWWINGEDTGYTAVASGGGSTGGSSTGSTISINADGYFVIDGQVTEYSANVTSDELYEKLNTVIEYDTSDAFSATYSSVTDFDSGFNNFDTSTFSGWGGCIGKPSEVSVIRFKTNARENAITKMKVWLYNYVNGAKNVLSQATLEVNIAANTLGNIYWILDEEYVNSESQALFFAYSCDQYCTGYFSRNTLSSANTDEYIPMAYTYNVKDGNPKELSTFEASVNNNVGYHYMPVEVGEIAPVFKLKESAIMKILEDLNLNKSAYQNTDLVLAKTIYGYAGQTMQIYFRNISAYDLDQVNIRVVSGKSTDRIYTDRWEYTPTAAENFTLKIETYDKNWSLLSTSTHSVVIKDSVSSSSVKALVIGDSTVFGGGQGHETAKMVSLASADSQLDLTLLGTMGSGDNKYEGRGGWTAGQYLTSETLSGVTNAFYNPSTSGFDFSYYMTQQGYDGVDVVFLQLGINDIFGSSNDSIETSAKNYVTNMQSIVTKIHAYDANIKIVINPIIPCTFDQDAFTAVYNSSQTVWGFLRNMYKTNQAMMEAFDGVSNVYISWYNAALDVTKNQTSDVHPSTAGYQQLGEQMYYMLKAII